jgi:predicted  nucleic acid-binding Zn-ribbon protein
MIDAADEIEELEQRLATAEAAESQATAECARLVGELAFEKNENALWETVCDELEANLAAAEAELESLHKDAVETKKALYASEALLREACRGTCTVTADWYERARAAGGGRA